MRPTKAVTMFIPNKSGKIFKKNKYISIFH